MTQPTGYLSQQYAEALNEFGTPIQLDNCQSWILQRDIESSDKCDAMWCYPLFSCGDWSQLHHDFEDLNGKIVSFTAVTDPFGNYDEKLLRKHFKDVVFPFKDHYVISLAQGEDGISSHHKRNIRKGMKNIDVDLSDNPISELDEWSDLYDVLIKKMNLNGLTKFSKKSFEKQLSVPGVFVFKAKHKNTTVGMLIWYVMGDIGYYHLGSYSEKGYELRASYALFQTAIKYFSDLGLAWLNLGSGAGLRSNIDGLARFKAGWSTEIRKAYFCGRIFDHENYKKIVNKRAIPETKYFPAYREGEFS